MKVTGFGTVVVTAEQPLPDVTPWLRVPKLRKFMGKQDRMAVIAAAQAAQAAALTPDVLGERTGLFLVVGHIPFERADMELIASHSTRDGVFDMQSFSTTGIDQVNPLLTFRCLPNMPLFHVSLNLGLHGPSFITYPGAGQFALALQSAVQALEDGLVDVALVGAVADQDNFLVGCHRERLGVPSQPPAADVAAFICLETKSSAARRGVTSFATLDDLEIGYQPHDPFTVTGTAAHDRERADLDGDHLTVSDCLLGPAVLPAWLGRLMGHSGTFTHELHSGDGLHVTSRWSMA